jgi:hypothetical protein
MTQRTLTFSLKCLGSSPFIGTQYTSSPSAPASLSIGNASSDPAKNLTFYYFDYTSVTKIHGISIYKFDDKGNNITKLLSKLLNNSINLTDDDNLNTNLVFRHMIADENSGYYTFYNTNAEDSTTIGSLFKSDTLYNFAIVEYIPATTSNTETVNNTSPKDDLPVAKTTNPDNGAGIVLAGSIIFICIGTLCTCGLIAFVVLQKKK